MAEEKKEKWMNAMAITTVLVAVCATFATFKGGGFGTKSLLFQSQASDKWSFYEAKSIKSYIFDMQRDNLEIQKASLPKTDNEKINILQQKIASYDKKLKQYEDDKNTIKEDAQKIEASRDEAQKHSAKFGIAVIFLQISILLSSISALTKKHYVYYLSLVVAVVGIFYFLDGWFLFYI